MRILTVKEMQRLEAAADASGHSFAEMMEQAGRGVANAVLARESARGRRVLVLVGPGNNGGDGLVTARYLAQAGEDVTCYLLKPRASDDPNHRALQEMNVSIADASNDQRWQVLRRLVAGADVIVDALLGTGTRLPLEGTVADLLRQVRATLKRQRVEQSAARPLTALVQPAARLLLPLVVAVDGPSGLDYDSGELDPLALPADVTVTFAYPKPGHFLFPGAGAVGELVVADIGVDPELAQDILGDSALTVITAEMVSELLPDRPRDAHKGTFGKALLVVGSINYTGAAYLAASGASRVGAGLVTLAVPPAIHGALAAKISEATFLLLPQTMGVVAPSAVGLLTEKMSDYQAMVLGCGLTQEKEAVEFVHKLFLAEMPSKRTGRIGFQSGGGSTDAESGHERMAFPSLVVDADGLNALTCPESHLPGKQGGARGATRGAASEDTEWWRRLPSGSVLTPHPGEMARLMGVETRTAQADRWTTAQEMAAKWGHVVLLKGAYSVVADPGGRVVVSPVATPALASAGSGDVLAGAIAGLLAQGLAPFDAAVTGVYLHGLAGAWAEKEIGPAGVIASDLLSRLPRAISALIGGGQPEGLPVLPGKRPPPGTARQGK